MNMRHVLWLFLIVVVGIIFRLWFIQLAPQPFGWDQHEYEMYTQKIFTHPLMLASHSYRSYTYPLMLAIFYRFVGFANHEAVFMLQAFMDSLVGVMVFLILLYGVKNQRAAWIGLFLYTINPFTAGYVGVLLAEVMTTFFITATIASGLLFLKYPRAWWGVLFGLCAGIAAETRNAAFVWAAIPIVLTLLWVSWRHSSRAYIGVAVGLLLTVVYPLYVNWRDFHEISITTVDDFYAKEFYQGVYLKRLPPFTYVYPVESQIMWSEYYSEYDPGRTSAQRRAMAQKYYGKAWDLIWKDPLDYIKVRFEKMWYMWQKENVFFYDEPEFAEHRQFTYWINVGILVFSWIGIILGLWGRDPQERRRGEIRGKRWVLASVLGTFLYATLAFSLTHAEYRLTIPFYPLLFIAASLGIAFLWQKFRFIGFSRS